MVIVGVGGREKIINYFTCNYNVNFPTMFKFHVSFLFYYYTLARGGLQLIFLSMGPPQKPAPTRQWPEQNSGPLSLVFLFLAGTVACCVTYLKKYVLAFTCTILQLCTVSNIELHSLTQVSPRKRAANKPQKSQGAESALKQSGRWNLFITLKVFLEKTHQI